MSDTIPAEQCLRTADVERVLQSVIRFPALEGGGFTVEGTFLTMEHEPPLTTAQLEHVLATVFYNTPTICGVPVYKNSERTFARCFASLGLEYKNPVPTMVTVEAHLDWVRVGVRDDHNPHAVLGFRDRWLEVLSLAQQLEGDSSR